jgi:branched-chain amino acid transport system substrate-binding protein
VLPLANGVLSIAPSNYDIAPELPDRFRRRFGYFMVHEAVENTVCTTSSSRPWSAQVGEAAGCGRRIAERTVRRRVDKGHDQFNKTGLKNAVSARHGATARRGPRSVWP